MSLFSKSAQNKKNLDLRRCRPQFRQQKSKDFVSPFILHKDTCIAPAIDTQLLRLPLASHRVADGDHDALIHVDVYFEVAGVAVHQFLLHRARRNRPLKLCPVNCWRGGKHPLRLQLFSTRRPLHRGSQSLRWSGRSLPPRNIRYPGQRSW